MQAVIELPQKLIGGQLRRQTAQVVQQAHKCLHRFLPTGAAGFVIVALGAPTDAGQQIRREAEQRRAQHGDERHILPRVVHDL